MACIFRGATCLEVWRAACAALDQAAEINSIILEVSDTTTIDNRWLTSHNPQDVKPSVKRSARDVANTIFPERIHRQAPDRTTLYERYMKAYERGKRRPQNRSTWGTYFLRMICFGKKKVNRLEDIIVALNTWQTTVRTPFVMHLSSSETDGLRTISGPCLQYIQFVRNADRTLDLAVVVRNHDYFEKALGNLVGLTRLLQFVCAETQLQPGKLVCHSVHAYSSATKKALRDLAT